MNKEIESWGGSLHRILKSDTNNSKSRDKLALVLVGEQSEVNAEDEIHIEDNADINADDNSVSDDHSHIFNSSFT